MRVEDAGEEVKEAGDFAGLSCENQEGHGHHQVEQPCLKCRNRRPRAMSLPRSQHQVS